MDTLTSTKFPKIFHPCLEEMPGNDWLHGLLKEIISKKKRITDNAEKIRAGVKGFYPQCATNCKCVCV